MTFFSVSRHHPRQNRRIFKKPPTSVDVALAVERDVVDLRRRLAMR